MMLKSDIEILQYIFPMSLQQTSVDGSTIVEVCIMLQLLQINV